MVVSPQMKSKGKLYAILNDECTAVNSESNYESSRQGAKAQSIRCIHCALAPWRELPL
jgi:hypothetical protein